MDTDLNQYKIVVPLFGAAYAVPNKDNDFILILQYQFLHYLSLVFSELEF